MRQRIILFTLIALFLTGCGAISSGLKLNPYSLDTEVVALPLEAENVTFKEISYDARLNRVIIPGAETGLLALLDPETRSARAYGGFSEENEDGFALGAISTAVGRDVIFALDRTARQIRVVNPETGQILSSTRVQAAPDFIRFVTATNEVWVTQTERQQIEVFRLSPTSPPELESVDTIDVVNGPENLIIDRRRGLAFTYQPETGTTAVIQVMTHGIIDTWGNGCSKARGMAIDDARGYLFIACGEGKLVMLDINNDGFQLASVNYGGDLHDVVYNPQKQHIYLPSAASALLAVFQVKSWQPTPAPDAAGEPPTEFSLVRLGTADTVMGAAFATVDSDNVVWVCDPQNGRVLRIEDTFPTPGEE